MILISTFRRNYSQRVIDIDLKATRNPSLFVIRDYSVPAKLKCGIVFLYFFFYAYGTIVLVRYESHPSPAQKFDAIAC